MATNYSRYDKLRGKEAWGLPICLALAAGLLCGGIKYCNNYKNNIYENQSQEVRVVQSQESQDLCSRNPNELERLVDKYRRER